MLLFLGLKIENAGENMDKELSTHELKEDLSDVHELMEELTCFARKISAEGLHSPEINTKEFGELIDMIKDLAETKRNCYEALYYESVVNAMEEADEERYGYNPRRYSSGRYAPAGRGHMGYTPSHININRMDENDRFGFYMEPHSDLAMWDSHWDNKYGKAYNQYKDSRRHYTESHNPQHKIEMDTYANEHLNDVMMSLKDIYKDIDPDKKKAMKDSLTKFISEMV